MKFWQGFILLWVLFFLFIFSSSFFGKSLITGYAPLTGVLKEDPSFQVVSPEMNVSFWIGEGPFYRLWDVDYFISFEKEKDFDVFVDLKYFIFDVDNNLICSDEEKILVRESEVFEKDLDTRKVHELDLLPGNYVFVLEVIFGEEEITFSEKFVIKKLSGFLYSLRQLFDIRMELYSSSFYNLDDFGARVVFENFGNETTPVNLTFFIYDNQGEEVYRKYRSEVVETEKVVFENFENLEINPGKYTLVLRTLYNVDVEDYFEQEFEYLKKENYWFLLIIFVIVVLGLLFLFRNRFGEEKKGK
ncbi:MAG TPA: hypothetical protein VJ895_02540 [Candidatus Nanoarchaeia archaeon]|nr:hypothetical protein [Candidatus Nanoarchaeia archaeon]